MMTSEEAHALIKEFEDALDAWHSWKDDGSVLAEKNRVSIYLKVKEIRKKLATALTRGQNV